MAVKKKLAAAKTAESESKLKKASGTKSKKISPAVKTKVKVKKPEPAATATEPAKKAVTRKTRANGAKTVISVEQRNNMIRTAAYLLSLKRDPCNGCPDMDWINAETVIDMLYEVKT
jgi:hypothetical protein